VTAEDFERVVSHSKLGAARARRVLYESGQRQRRKRSTRVYFRTTAIVYAAQHAGGRASAEIAVVGNEGIIGVLSVHGGETTPSRAVVTKCRGPCVSPSASASCSTEDFIRGDAMQHLLAAYTAFMLT
jgi:hypothetical protein